MLPEAKVGRLIGSVGRSDTRAAERGAAKACRLKAGCSNLRLGGRLAIVRVLEGVRAPEGLEQEFAVFLVASYVNDRDLADPEDGFVIVQAE